MKTHLSELVDAAVSRLSGPPPHADRTDQTYTRALQMWWEPYARVNGLPVDFSDENARALTIDEVKALVGAAATGGVRCGTRDGERDLADQPLAPATMDGLCAALHWAHIRAGLAWVGDERPEALRPVRVGYRRTHGRPTIQARPMTSADTSALFDAPPQESNDLAFRQSVVRATCLQGLVPFDAVANLMPTDVSTLGIAAIVRIGSRSHVIECIAPRFDDIVATATCAHCLLSRWASEADAATPLLLGKERAGAYRVIRRLAERVQGASFRDNRLTADELSDGTLFALVWSSDVANWVEARAMLLPMRDLGLRSHDVSALANADVRFHANKVTVNLHRKAHRGNGTAKTLRTVDSVRCPVNALRAYDAWVRAFLPERRRFFVSVEGRPVKYPTDRELPSGSSAVYQHSRKWLLAHDASGSGTPNARQRATLTPHSARVGFAHAAQARGEDVWSIQEAMGHASPATTLRYMDQTGDAASKVLDAIARDRSLL